MRGAAGAIEFVAQPLDLLTQLVTLVPIPIPIAIGPRLLAAQALDLALLPLELGDQLVARCGAPVRLHRSVMPRRATEYKYDFLDLASRRPQSPAATR
jgi:hypothetical protein